MFWVFFNSWLLTGLSENGAETIHQATGAVIVGLSIASAMGKMLDIFDTSMLGLSCERTFGHRSISLVLRREQRVHGHRAFAGCSSPHVGTWIEDSRKTLPLGPFLVEFGDLHDFSLNVRKGIEGNARDTVFDAILLQAKTAASKEDVGLASSGQIGHAVADEYDQRDGTVVALQLRCLSVFFDGELFIMAELIIVAPYGLPLGSVLGYGSVVGDNVDVRRFFFAEEVVQNFSKHGL